MATVGYGDIYPESVIGQLVIYSAAITGTLLLALLIDTTIRHTVLGRVEKLQALVVREPLETAGAGGKRAVRNCRRGW